MKTSAKINRIFSFLLIAAALVTLISGCEGIEEPQPNEALPTFASYQDIPGLTQQDLQDIENILQARSSFSYAMLLSTEAFYDINDDIKGFAKEFCEYLTTIFGIPFVPQIVGFEDIFEGLEDGSIDFTGTLTPTDRRREVYHMTDPIAQRAIKYFRLAGSEPIEEIRQERMPRFALLDGAVSTQTVLEFAVDEFEPVFIEEYIDAYEMLQSGEIDALLAESSVETTFDAMEDVVKEDFFPMINAFVSFTAYDDGLVPIINAVQKMLENGGAYYIGELYDDGYRDYLKHKLMMQLTQDEWIYIANNPIIYFGAEFDNYPISFYDERSGQWQGISVDVLKEICRLTGLEYSILNEPGANFDELVKMLENGDVHMISELIYSPEREGSFLWPKRSFINDQSVLMSRTGYHYVHIDRIYSEKVGLVRNTAHTEFFNTWFPTHPHTVMYDDYVTALEALRDGEIDLLMTSNSTNLYMSNYMEETVYKPCIRFDNNFESTFGINKNHELLLSITDKALELVDITTITDNWLHKTYDYRLSLAEQNNDLFRNMILVMLCILILVIALLIRNHYMSRSLGELVDSRTKELAESVREISRARDEAEVANKSKSYFLANMSHEIRTPMNAIAGITEIILLDDNIAPDVKEGLIKINNSCDLLMGIINDILDFSKIEAGKLDIVNKEYSVASVINDSAQLNMMRIGEKDIKFRLDIDENTPAKLIGDELRIKQIMNNLLSNAFKYTDKGEVKLSVHAESDEEFDDKEVTLVISVEDTGCGMTEGQLKKLFEEYTRFYQEVNASVEGTGLGLAITHRLISLMGGNIDIESLKDVGSTFTVRLPQTKTDDEIIGKEITDSLAEFRMGMGRSEKGRSIVRDPMPYGHVLCVDDVETNLYVAMGLMKPYMLNIDTALSGHEAIDMIENGKTYDVVFMDHMMPDMDGVETTRILRQLGYNEPVVALTANAVAGQSEMFLKNGFDDFIAKPIDIRQLNDVLNRLVRDKQPIDVIEAAREEYAAQKRSGKSEPDGNAQKRQNPVSGSSEYSSEPEEQGKSLGIADRRIDRIDIPSGIEKYNDDEDIYIKILGSYATNARAILGDIKALNTISKENLDTYRLKVHSMKGTSLDIFATQIGTTAAKLEQCAKDGELEYINSHTAQFLDDAGKLVDDLDALLLEITTSNPREARDFPDKDALKRLSDACDLYSMDGVNSAMDEIEKFEYKNDDGLVEWLKEKVNMMAFAEIVDRLSGIIGG